MNKNGAMSGRGNTPCQFAVGKYYRLRTVTSNLDMMPLDGWVYVHAVLMPTDIWGNRVLLVDCRDNNTGNTYLGMKCYVQMGYPRKAGFSKPLTMEVGTIEYADHKWKMYAEEEYLPFEMDGKVA